MTYALTGTPNGMFSARSVYAALQAKTAEKITDSLLDIWAKITDFIGITHHEDALKTLCAIQHSKNSTDFQNNVVKLAGFVDANNWFSFREELRLTVHPDNRVTVFLGQYPIAEVKFKQKFEPDSTYFSSTSTDNTYSLNDGVKYDHNVEEKQMQSAADQNLADPDFKSQLTKEWATLAKYEEQAELNFTIAQMHRFGQF